MRSEGFPFIVWGSGGWTLVRLECLVGSSSGRRRRVVNSVSMGEAAKPLLFEGFQAGCHVVVCGRRGTLWHSNLFDNVSKVGSLARNARFAAPTCLVSSLWFCCGVAVSLGEAAKPLLFEGFQAGCHVVVRGRRGTLWHSNLFDNVSKVSKSEEVSHEMLVLLRPLVSSRVSGFPVASLCLWGKLQNLSFSKVSKQVVMSLCVAGAALCEIPTCLITCRNFVAGATMRSLHAPHLHSTLYTPHSTLYTLHSTLYTPHFTLYTPHSTLYTPHSTLYTLHSTLHTLHFTLYTLHSTLYTLHSTLYTLHSSFHTLHSTLYTPHLHSTLSTPHSTLYTFHSTPQTGNRGNMYEIFQINYCWKVFCVTAYPYVSTSVPLTYVWAFRFVGCILWYFFMFYHVQWGLNCQNQICWSQVMTLMRRQGDRRRLARAWFIHVQIFWDLTCI